MNPMNNKSMSDGVVSHNRTILVVDDEPRIVQILRKNLELEGYRVIGAANGVSALQKAVQEMPNLIVLDIMMPEMDGFEVLQRLRKISDVPIIMLSAKDLEEDKVHGLELGADDYISKPFGNKEMLSRIRAVLRRSDKASLDQKSRIVVDGQLTIDFDKREVIVRGERMPLRATEYRLLYHLVSNAGKVLTHETLLSRVWGPDYQDEDHYVRLYITYLRKKIEEDPRNPKYILNERGMGYRFKDLSSDTEGIEDI